MSLSSYNPSDRYRQRKAHRVLAVLRMLAILGCAGAFGFWLGRMYVNQEVMTLRAEREVLMTQRDELQESFTLITAEAQTANARFDQLQENFEEALPEGPMRDLMALVKKQLGEGMDPSRLMLAVRSARPPRNCADPESRRFVVTTPAYEGPDSRIVLADNTITISGGGASARNDQGQAEAWYDPSQSVQLAFTLIGGKKQDIQGVLPLHYSMVLGAREYRFTISEGARSFAKVTFDSCDYP